MSELLFPTLAISFPVKGVVTVTLNRPDARNAMSWQLIKDLQECLQALSTDKRCRVIVLTGAGSAFCAGLDLMDQAKPESLAACIGEFRAGPESGMKAQEFMVQIMRLMQQIPQPIIAAVNGAAYGGGLGIALAADIRMASPNAKFCTQFIRLGLSGCDAGVSYFLPRLIGAGRAQDMILTARVVDAALAEQWGLVTRLSEQEKLLEDAEALAETLCDFSPYGLISTKQGVRANIDAGSLDAALQIENRNQILNGLSGHVEEAAMAFFEKRKPNFD